MSGIFYKASSFNQKLDKWDTGKVTSMRSMFNRASSFNNGDGTAPLVLDTSKVTNKSFMFQRHLILIMDKHLV